MVTIVGIGFAKFHIFRDIDYKSAVCSLLQ